MNRATGIQIAGNSVRLASLERKRSGYRLCALFEATLTLPLLPRWPVPPQVRECIGDTLQRGFAQVRGAPGSVVLSPGGGFFHLQKTPLEQAAAADRLEHVTWEAAQTLVDPIDRYVVDYVASGRTAFWFAVRKEVFDFWTELLSPLGVEQFRLEAEPMGLFHACRLIKIEAGSRIAGIMVVHPWVYLVAMESDYLIAAEAACLDRPDTDNGLPTVNMRGESYAKETAAVIRRWLGGGAHAHQSRYGFRRVLLCGEKNQIATLPDHFELARVPKHETLAPFSKCTTETLPDPQRHFLASQPAFSMAGGLAHMALEKEKS